MKASIVFLFLVAVGSFSVALITMAVITHVGSSWDDCDPYPNSSSLAKYKGAGMYELSMGDSKFTLDSEGYIKYLEGVVGYLSGELDSLETDDRYVAVIMTTESDPEVIGRMGLRLPEGAQIKYTRGFNSGSWEKFPVDLYLDNRISILGQPDAPAITLGVVSFRFPKGEFPSTVEEIVPPGSTYQVDVTKAY